MDLVKNGSLPAVRRAVEEMEEYVPISTPESLAEKLGLRPDQIVKVDGNENPYGCSPRVQRALAGCDFYNRYPDPMQVETRALLASFLGVPAERLMLGAGSDELIDTLMRVYLEPGDEIMDFPPTFGMYPFSAQVCGAGIVAVPRLEDFEINIDGAEKALTPRIKMVFLASPNNPSGNLASRKQVERLLATGRIVVVDEAYTEFASSSLLPLAAEHPNLVILRTFSKWAGLAGLRVGYGIFSPGVIRQMWKIKQPYNLNVAAQLAVRETLADHAWLQANVDRLTAERSRMLSALRGLDFLRVYPSEANFLLCDVLDGNAEEIVRFLAARGIIIRYFRKARLYNSIRISVGLPEHTDAIAAALQEWRATAR